MKKLQLVLWVLLLTNLCSAQEVLVHVAKNYFRSNPFDREISQFINHLMKDPTLVNTTINKRTDSNFFYFRGDYTTHHPFFFKAKRTQVILAEQEIITNDSLQLVDTIITYQLAGLQKVVKTEKQM